MAKRKSINKRLSRYNRSSIGSGFLDPNSEVLGEEEPFWWNNLTNNTNQSLAKYNATNQTSKYLDSDSQAELSDATDGWWNVLGSTDSEVSYNLLTIQTNKPDTVPKTTKATISDSDEEDGPPLPQKKKITIRGKSKRNKSNPFLKAFIDSESSKLSKSIQDATVLKSTNNSFINNESLKESDFIEDHKTKRDNINVTASTDQSHITDTILKSKPQVFRKRYDGKRDNVFEDLIKSTEDKHNETEATDMITINSSKKLIERDRVLEENFSNATEGNDTNILKEHISEMHSLIKNVSTRSITNPTIFKHDGNHIYHEHSDSSFEIQSDHIDEASQKESSIKENCRKQIIDSTYSPKEINKSHVNNKTTESPENNNKNEKLVKRLSHTRIVNNSNISQNNTHSRMNNSKTSFNMMEQDNVDDKDMTEYKSDNGEQLEAYISTPIHNRMNVHGTANFDEEYLSKDNNKTQPVELDTGASTSKQKSKRTTGRQSEILSELQTDNLNEENFSKSNDRIQPEEYGIGSSSLRQKSKRTIGRQSKILSELQTDNLNKESFSKSDDRIQSEEYSIGSSSLRQKSKRTIGTQSKILSKLQTDNLNKGTLSRSDDRIQPEELDTDASISKQKSKRTNGRQSKILSEFQTDNLNKETLSKSDDRIQPEEYGIGSSSLRQKSKRTIGRQSKILSELQTDNLNKETLSKSDDRIQPEEYGIGSSSLRQKSKRTIGRQSKILSELQTDNLNKESFSKSNDRIQSEEYSIGSSSLRQKSKRTIGRQSKILSKLQTDNLNKGTLSKSDDRIQLEELDTDASTSKQKCKEIINIVSNNNSQNVYEMDQLRHKTTNATNCDPQRRINEYFTPSTYKLTSPTKVKESKNIQLAKKTKEDEEIKKRWEQKKRKLDEYLSKAPSVTLLTGKELREQIKKLRNEGTTKQPIKTEIHPAYLVNGKRYRRPKLPRPQSWATNRLYRYLWKVMEPKYKLLTRVESEKFVQRLSNSVSMIIKSKKYEDYKDELDDLMNNMARLNIIHTRNDFYDFSYEYLPYDFRVKVVPMIMPGNVRNVPYDPENLYEPLIEK